MIPETRRSNRSGGSWYEFHAETHGYVKRIAGGIVPGGLTSRVRRPARTTTSRSPPDARSMTDRGPEKATLNYEPRGKRRPFTMTRRQVLLIAAIITLQLAYPAPVGAHLVAPAPNDRVQYTRGLVGEKRPALRLGLRRQ